MFLRHGCVDSSSSLIIMLGKHDGIPYGLSRSQVVNVMIRGIFLKSFFFAIIVFTSFNFEFFWDALSIWRVFLRELKRFKNALKMLLIFPFFYVKANEDTGILFKWVIFTFFFQWKLLLDDLGTVSLWNILSYSGRTIGHCPNIVLILAICV